MAKYSLKYTGLVSADKLESAKACLTSHFSYGAEEAEFYLNNPPIDLLESDDEAEVKAKADHLIAAGAKCEIAGASQSSFTAPPPPEPPKQDVVQELILELEDSAEKAPAATTSAPAPEPVKKESEPKLELEFESSTPEPVKAPASSPPPAPKAAEPELKLEFDSGDAAPTPPPAPAKSPEVKPEPVADLDLSLMMDEPAKPSAPPVSSAPVPDSKEEKLIEVEAADKTMFKIDTGKVLSGSAVVSQSQKQNKAKIRIPPEYVVPMMAGAGVIIVMAYILFPSTQQSSGIGKVAPTNLLPSDEAPEAKEAQVKFYKYAAEYKDNDITAQAKFTATDKGLKFVNLDVVTPFAAELTAEEIVLKKKPRPWLSKINIEKLEFKLNQETGTFDTSSQVRAFLEYGEEKVRIAAPIIGRAKYEAGQQEFQAAFLIKYNTKEIPAGKTYGISAENENYSFFVKFQITAKLTSESKN